MVVRALEVVNKGLTRGMEGCRRCSGDARGGDQGPVAVDEGCGSWRHEKADKWAIFLMFDMMKRGEEVLDRMESWVNVRVGEAAWGVSDGRVGAGRGALEKGFGLGNDFGELAGGDRFPR